jgi:hypothetical protein
MGSAQAVDDASAMMAKAAEASITRWNIWGIFRRLLVLVSLTTVVGRVLIGQDFQDFRDLREVVVFDFVEEGFVADAQIFSGFALVTPIGRESSADFPALDVMEGAVSHIGECSGEVELVQCFVSLSC